MGNYNAQHVLAFCTMNHLNHFYSRFKKIAFVRQMWKKRDQSVRKHDQSVRKHDQSVRKHDKMLIKKPNSGILYLIHKAVYNVQKEGGCIEKCNVLYAFLQQPRMICQNH